MGETKVGIIAYLIILYGKKIKRSIGYLSEAANFKLTNPAIIILTLESDWFDDNELSLVLKFILFLFHFDTPNFQSMSNGCG